MIFILTWQFYPKPQKKNNNNNFWAVRQVLEITKAFPLFENLFIDILII